VVLNKLLRAFQQRQGAARRRIRKLTSQTPFLQRVLRYLLGFWLWQIGEEDGGGDCRLLNWDPITPETGGLRCEGVPVEEGAIFTALSFDKSPKLNARHGFQHQ